MSWKTLVHQSDGRRGGRRVRRHARELARRLLAGFGFGDQRRVQHDERLDDVRIERFAAFLAQQAERGVEAHRFVIRPLRHERVEIVDH